MNAGTTAEAVDALAVGMVVLSIGMIWTRSARQAVLLVAIQSLLLAAVGLVTALHTHREHLFVGVGLIVAVKAISLPAVMAILIVRTRANGVMPTTLPRGLGVAAAVALSLVTIETFSGDPFETPLGATRALPAAVAVILLGLQTMITRHHVIAQITGFLVIENGMALAGVTATYGMPLVIEFGVLLDLLLAVMVAFVYSKRIHEAYGDLHTKVLRELRG